MKRHIVKATYDFAVKGGATGDIGLGVFIPKGAIVRKTVLMNEETGVTSGGSATVALATKTQGGTKTTIMAATAYASITDMAEVAASTATKLSASGEVTVVIATAALTAGKVHFIIEYDI